jgi:hypothetical protein
MPRRHLVLTLASLLFVLVPLSADEGMWTFDNPPRALLKEKYGFEPTQEWLDHLRLASVRFMDGGSGSFVSPAGLMITNHHVGLGCIQNVSTAERDHVRDGFHARTRAEEVACPGYEVNVLEHIEDVSSKVLGAVTAGMSDAEAREARKAAIAGIEQACNTGPTVRCDVVTLYDGGEFDLYRYKKYTDVRLVFAPERQIAFFGGDPDNFTFPRHDLDICLMRAYENGAPARPVRYLRWSQAGVADGDLVFVSGHPGSTSRLQTVAQVEYQRDSSIPFRLETLNRRLGVLRAYAARGDEQRRRALDQIFGYENSLKAYEGFRAALQDRPAMQRKIEEEQALRTAAAAGPAQGGQGGDPWSTVASAQRALGSRAPEVRLVGFGGSRLLEIAGTLVWYVAEIGKPNGARYEEFTDANLDSLRNELFSAAPIHADLEEATLTDQFALALEKLGPDHPFVKAVLEGRTPADAARAVVGGTKLGDPAARRALADGGSAAVAASTDPAVALARRIDPLAREVRAFVENSYDAPVTRAAERIAQARWKTYGKTVPPDATFTLRLAYGTVKGFPAEGTQVAPFTTFFGLYDRSLSHGGAPPWDLPPRWLEAREALDLSVPLNFASTNDIIGGNSGSPVVNRAGEFVGVIFDGNIHSLAWNYYYTGERGRAVSVDARAILEALRQVFDAGEIAAELTGR